jgi:hypothetical protein
VFLNGGGDTQATRRFLHHFNPYHWPTWYSTNLWFVFAGLFTALLLKINRIQSTLHSFYASRFWQSAKTRIKKSKPNQAVVRFCLHKKIGKWLLQKWLLFWRNVQVERYPAYVWAFAFIAIFIVFFRHAAMMEMPRFFLQFCWRYPYYFLIYNIYTPYYFAPLVEFNFNGTITWRLFIAPTTGLLLIVWLLRIASQSKKKRNAS